MGQERLLKTKEACEYLGISESTLYKKHRYWAERFGFPTRRNKTQSGRGALKFKQSELDRMMEAQG